MLLLNPNPIALFPPPLFELCDRDPRDWLDTSLPWTYASSGKAAIYHLLLDLNIQGEVALPAYACASMLVPLDALGLKARFFDIDPADLNPSCESLLEILDLYPQIQAVLFPSFYGLPADLEKAEQICQSRGVALIDDGAQSHGSSLNGRPIGSFGQGGFFSFSPGKATAGHLGAYYWSSRPRKREFSRSPMQHRLKWWLFKVQRLQTQRWIWGRQLWSMLKILSNLWESKIPLWNDRPEDFEKPILSGILQSLYQGSLQYRLDHLQHIQSLSIQWSGVRLVQSLRGQAHPHKWVLIFDQVSKAQEFSLHLKQHSIEHGRGYVLLDSKHCPQALSLSGRILELPLLQNPDQMQSLIQCTQSFFLK